MTVLRIEGGNPLHGQLEVPGSKNAALAIMSAVVLAEGTTVLDNMPDISDVQIKASLLEKFGAKCIKREGSLYIDCSHLYAGECDEETVRLIRTSFYLLGPLLARIGKVQIPMPGGCKIGARPVDLHLKGLELLGAKVEMEHGNYIASTNGLRGADIYLDLPSAGATQHLMSTAVLAKGITTIRNAAFEPEVTALADFLCRMGAKIEGAGTSTITVYGVDQLEPCRFRIPHDRLQAGTYLLAGAITNGDVQVNGILPENQAALLSKLKDAGAKITEGHDWVRVEPSGRLKGIRIKTMPYPGFATDMQQPMAALLCTADGTSVIDETIYESRNGHVAELNRMGAKIRLEGGGRTALFSGVERLKGAVVEASDLRAGAALCLAGLAAEGETIVKNVHFIDRGYEQIETVLSNLGARIERVASADMESSMLQTESRD